MRLRLAWIAALVAACGGGGGGNSDSIDASDVPIPDADPNAPDADPTVPDAAPDANPSRFTKLIQGTWSLTPGQRDTYHCTRLTLREDVYIHAFRADAP